MHRKNTTTYIWLVLTCALCISLASGAIAAGADWSAFDQIADSYKTTTTDPAAIATHLTNQTQSQVGKARVLYRWITTNIDYDTASLLSGSKKNQDPKAVLASRIALCSGYALLFEAMAKAAGLEVAVIPGYSKGYLSIFDRALPRDANHAWNAVKVDGEWKLLDCTWGAGYIDQQQQFVRRFSNHYFFTDPAELIYDHYPLNPDWQLMKPAIAADAYQRRVKVWPSFFRSGMRVVSHPDTVIQSDGKVNIEIATSGKGEFMAELFRDGREVPSSTLTQHSADKLTVSAKVPEAGKYTLRIYVKENTSADKYTSAAEYVINAASGSGIASSFPEIFEAYNTKKVQLITPTSGNLEANQSVDFKLVIPGAEKVAVIVGKKWTYLDRKSGDVFEGPVEVENGNVDVAAKFPESKMLDVILRFTGS